jgi:hypothetical protein
MIGKLKVRDISYYGKTGFEELINIEKPDLVFFLSTHTFAHRAFQRYCRQRNIPTIHSYHGLVRVQAVDNSNEGPYKINILAYARFAISKLPKLLRYTWPCYCIALFKTNASFKEWAAFFKEIIYAIIKPGIQCFSDDAKTTKCLVYASTDRQHAMKMYGFNSNDVIDVGNPDLIQFGIKSEMIGQAIEKDTLSLKEVMYIDTALTATGIIFNNNSEYVDHILQIKKTLLKQGKTLIFKPHPETKRLGVSNQIFKLGIEVIDNTTFALRLNNCCAAIVETSSLSIIPALMGMTIFLVQFGKFKSLKFGEVLFSYPRAHYYNDLDEFTFLLEKDQSTFNHLSVMKWIDENCGALPIDEMPQRVTKVVLDLINNKAY